MSSVTLERVSQTKQRYLFIDTIRGFAVVNMILYHLCWNIDNLTGIKLNWYHTNLASLWQFLICGTFLLLAGFCIRFSSRILKHTIILAICAMSITLVTSITGDKTLIVFGILHCMTLCFIIFMLIKNFINQIPSSIGLCICILLFIITYNIPNGYLGFFGFGLYLPKGWYVSYWLSLLGLLSPDFRSADYFPIFPYLFLFLAGYYLSKLNFNIKKDINIKSLAFIGQHSLIIYLVHQPVLYILMLPIIK